MAATDTSSTDQLLGLLATGGQPPFHQHQVETLLCSHSCDHSTQQLEQSPRNCGAIHQSPEDCCTGHQSTRFSSYGHARFLPCRPFPRRGRRCGVAATGQLRATSQSACRPASLSADPVSRRALLGAPAGLGLAGAMGSGASPSHPSSRLTPPSEGAVQATHTLVWM
jgi:hypothetical protein